MARISWKKLLISILCASIFLTIGWYIVLYTLGSYKENMRFECWGEVNLSEGNQLIEISETEKSQLGIGDLTPTRQYYEMRKCMKQKPFGFLL